MCQFQDYDIFSQSWMSKKHPNGLISHETENTFILHPLRQTCQNHIPKGKIPSRRWLINQTGIMIFIDKSSRDLVN